MNLSCEIVVVDETAMTAARDAAIRRMLGVCFPASADAFSKTRAWHGSAPSYSVVANEGEEIVGHVGVVAREISAGGASLRVAGIQNMAVLPARRGSGLSRRLMEAAVAEARRRGIPFGLLFCVPGLERFYASLGWTTLSVRVRMVYGGEETEIPAKNLAMGLDLAGRPFPAGDLHLRGADW
ncbi:MAG: GNAT family N-acetyltransferase [Verrucomicrobiae bacterium]|nr:GNAT family N-acetyltransferase [Verrucomicrobiae bacterium]